MSQETHARLDLYGEELRSSPIWIGDPAERVNYLESLVPDTTKCAEFSIWRLTKEVIFTISDGKYEFSHVMYMLDPTNFDIVLKPALTAIDLDEERQLEHLALAALYQVPVFPNTIDEAPRLERLYERLLNSGFSMVVEGKPQRFALTHKVAAVGYQTSAIEEIVPTRMLSPGEAMLIRRRIAAQLDELLAAKTTLDKIDNAIAELRSLLSSEQRNEHELQACLTRHPILLGSEYRRVIPKHQLGSEYEMDYALERHTGFVDLMEIEASSLALFTERGDPRKELVHAEQQIFDWIEWMEAHGDYARSKLPKIHRPRGVVVIGRSHSLNETTRRKLQQRNRVLSDTLEICTYDDLIERAVHLRDLISGKRPVGV